MVIIMNMIMAFLMFTHFVMYFMDAVFVDS